MKDYMDDLGRELTESQKKAAKLVQKMYRKSEEKGATLEQFFARGFFKKHHLEFPVKKFRMVCRGQA